MTIKHNAVRLETHSYLVANVSTSLARQKGEPIQFQRDCWEFGFCHDAGWFNLKKNFRHDEVEEQHVRLLLETAAQHYPKLRNYRFKNSLGELAEFARVHHTTRAGSFPAWNYVKMADPDATGLETHGFLERPEIFHSFSTPLHRSSTYRRLDLRRFSEHSLRIAEYRRILSQTESKLSKAVGIPFSAVIAETASGIRYHLPSSDDQDVKRRYRRWEEGRIGKGTLSFRGRYSVREIRKMKPALCFICNAPGRYCTNLGDLAGLGLELDTWLDSPRTPTRHGGRNGICDNCLSALLRQGDIRYNILILPPLPQRDLVVRKRLVQDQLQLWSKLKHEGKCDPDEQWLDLATWEKTRMFSDIFIGVDVQREAFERSQEIFDQTLKAANGTRHGIVGTTELKPRAVARKLKTIHPFAPINFGSVAITESSIVTLNGYRFPGRTGLLGLRLADELPTRRAENWRCFEDMATELLRLGYDASDIEPLEPEFSRFKEALTA
jgi:hypothetical protein